MKTNRINSVAGLSLGLLLAFSPFTKASDSTNTAPGNPPPGETSTTPKGKGRGGPGGPILEVLKTLDLNDEQKTKVHEAIKGQEEKVKALRGDTSLTPADRIAKIKEIREGMNEEMKKILTPDQYTKFEEGMKNARGAGRRGPGAPPPSGAAPAPAGTSEK